MHAIGIVIKPKKITENSFQKYCFFLLNHAI